MPFRPAAPWLMHLRTLQVLFPLSAFSRTCHQTQGIVLVTKWAASSRLIKLEQTVHNLRKEDRTYGLHGPSSSEYEGNF